MTKTKKAIKEANKMADNELLKAGLKSMKEDAIKWLTSDVEGFKRYQVYGIIVVSALIVLILN
tara:strand:+ start:154 stop:342 length:189 start_codon:yes stop_codon:yes gene_type:complete